MSLLFSLTFSTCVLGSCINIERVHMVNVRTLHLKTIGYNISKRINNAMHIAGQDDRSQSLSYRHGGSCYGVLPQIEEGILPKRFLPTERDSFKFAFVPAARSEKEHVKHQS